MWLTSEVYLYDYLKQISSLTFFVIKKSAGGNLKKKLLNFLKNHHAIFFYFSLKNFNFKMLDTIKFKCKF